MAKVALKLHKIKFFVLNCNPLQCLLKQLDYSSSFSMSDSQLACTSLTIRLLKTMVRSLTVKKKKKRSHLF